MLSTRKQKKRSRQSDVMSDFKNLNLKLGNFSEGTYVFEQENVSAETDSVSEGLQENTITQGDGFSSLLNSPSGGNSDITVETIRAINEQLNSQISRNLKKIKMELNSQILATLNSTITEKVIPELHESIIALGNGITEKSWTKGHQDYTGTPSNHPKKDIVVCNFILNLRDSSLDSNVSD